MTMRQLSPAIFAALTFVALAGCTPPEDLEIREPYVDEWVEEATLPAAQFSELSIGDRLFDDNYANRGNIEVRYVEGTDRITIEMQRFTVASNQTAADEAFAKMYYWGYDLSGPEQPSDDNAVDLCDVKPDAESCYVRVYYDGLFQPLRDGANFRVTIPVGWRGDLELTTADNLGEGVESYPDRSDIIVDGVAGNIEVDMDSGNVQIRMDPSTPHFAGCANNDECVEGGFDPMCGCSEPTNVNVVNNSGQASNITVDVGDPDAWYTMILENRGTFSASDDFVCNATIECDDFSQSCAINPDYANLDYQERAEVNLPPEPAVEGTGIRISLASESCANITYVDGPGDFEVDPLPSEKRGELRVCVGCLSDL